MKIFIIGPTCQDEHLLAEHDVVGDEVSREEEGMLPVPDLHNLPSLFVIIVQDLGEAGVAYDTVVAVVVEADEAVQAGQDVDNSPPEVPV